MNIFSKDTEDEVIKDAVEEGASKIDNSNKKEYTLRVWWDEEWHLGINRDGAWLKIDEHIHKNQKGFATTGTTEVASVDDAKCRDDVLSVGKVYAEWIEAERKKIEDLQRQGQRIDTKIYL